MSAAIHVIAAQGLGAATATIAKVAGVSNGSLFTYFETKADLFNQLYLELKTEMAEAALDELPAASSMREQLRHAWTHWLRWATSSPEKRRALAQLEVSDDITPASRHAANRTMSGVGTLLERSREHGAMRGAPLGLVVALTSALADATIDFVLRDRANAEQHASDAFEALWRIVA